MMTRLNARQRRVLLRTVAVVGVGTTVALVRWIYALKRRARERRQYIEGSRALPRTVRTRSQGTRRVAVLGGGVSGLTAAWKLKKKSPNLEVHVFEAQADVGGLLQTVENAEGMRIEAGPRTLRTSTASAAVAIALIEELGLGDKLKWADRATRGRRFVYDYGTESLEELPTSLVSALKFVWKHRIFFAIVRDVSHALGHTTRHQTVQRGIAAQSIAMVRRGLQMVPFSGRLFGTSGSQSRTLSSPPPPAPMMASFASSSMLTCDGFFRENFSAHLADRFLSALVHGIFSGDSRQLLLKYSFPAMFSMKEAYGSLVVGSFLEPFLKLASSYDSPPLPACAANPAKTRLLAKAKRERVAVLDGGMATLIAGLWDNLNDAGVTVHTETPITRMAFNRDALEDKGSVVLYTPVAELRDGEVLDVDCVISTLPPHKLEALLESSLGDLSLTQECHDRVLACVEKLGRINTLSIAVITFVFPSTTFAEVVGASVNPGFGFLMPRHEERGSLLGVVYDSCVYPELAGRENVVLTAMVGGAEPEPQKFVETAEEAELLEYALARVTKLLDLQREPASSRVSRWVKSIPQFDHLYARARTDLEYCVPMYAPWLFVGGKGFGYGVGVNDSIMTSVKLAEEVAQVIGQ